MSDKSKTFKSFAELPTRNSKSKQGASDVAVKLKNENVERRDVKQTTTLIESWGDYMSGKMSLTSGERSGLESKIRDSYKLSTEQFEVFNRELIRRSGIPQNQKEMKSGLTYSLSEDQRIFLKILVNYISPGFDMGEASPDFKFDHPDTPKYNVEVALRGMERCRWCLSRVGNEKVIFPTKIIAESYVKLVVNESYSFQESYQCPKGYGWHLRTKR